MRPALYSLPFALLICLGIPINAATDISRIQLPTVDLNSNDIIYDRPLSPDAFGETLSHEAYVNSGIMMVSLMIDGYPVSNMKVFIP